MVPNKRIKLARRSPRILKVELCATTLAMPRQQWGMAQAREGLLGKHEYDCRAGRARAGSLQLHLR